MALLQRFGAASARLLGSPTCLYSDAANGLSLAQFWAQLTPSLPPACDLSATNIPYQTRIAAFGDALGRLFGGPYTFNGFVVTRWTSEHWEIPCYAVVVYLTMILVLQKFMATREKMFLQPVVVVWNFALSAFSFAGVYYTVPPLLYGAEAGLLTAGFYPSVCSHASAYGFGSSGFFVFLFIYSKLAELLDTLWLVLRKSPVILLHWYHHVTVLLYCWHAYSVRIGTGLWFAAMNYTVHAVMYFYFGLTQTGPRGRRLAKRFAFYITMMQLTQMVVGIGVTVSSIVYQRRGDVCYVSLVNSSLGLAMYSSYFILFLQLFVKNYYGPRSRTASRNLKDNPKAS